MRNTLSPRGVQGLWTLLLLLSWHLLWAPARGVLIPSRAAASSSGDADPVHLLAKVEPHAVNEPSPTGLGASTATAAVPPRSSQLRYGQNLSTSRRLLQPPGLPPGSRDITLQELLANIDVSADGSGGVRVALPPVPPPNRSSGSNSTADNRADDRGLPPVVVSMVAMLVHGCAELRNCDFVQQDLPPRLLGQHRPRKLP
jgi:hypothetical protein